MVYKHTAQSLALPNHPREFVVCYADCWRSSKRLRHGHGARHREYPAQRMVAALIEVYLRFSKRSASRLLHCAASASHRDYLAAR